MTYQHIKSKLTLYRPVQILEQFISHQTRVLLKKIFFLLSLLLFVLASGVFVAPSSGLTGFFFFSVFLLLILVAMDALYYSFGSMTVANEPFLFELSSILAGTSDSDIVGGFTRSRLGRLTLLRLGIGRKEIDDFLVKRTKFYSESSITIPDKKEAVTSYASGLVESDKEFSALLLSHGVNEELFVSCLLWVLRMDRKLLLRERFWSRDRLESVTSLGRDWAYGKAYTLMKMSLPLRFSTFQEEELHTSDLERVVGSLSRSEDANVLLVGEEGVGKMEIVEGLARLIMRHEAPKSLHDRHFFVLDEERLLASGNSGQVIERLMLKMFSEAASSGNVIMVIPNLASLLKVGDTFEVDVGGIMTRFLSSPSMHIIAICDSAPYHEIVEKRKDITKHCDIINVEESGVEDVLRVFEDSILEVEAKENVFFTYPALHEAVVSSEKYAPEDSLFDTVGDVLGETAGGVRGEGRSVIFLEDIKRTIHAMTGVAEEHIENDERIKLSHLEELLHERIVGQDRAIMAVSDAIRRARAGVASSERPVGSFLFLGPTGVGKTETAKALAEIFFGADAPLLRLDMSEYNTPESVNKLIGAFGSSTPGILSDMVRDNKSGVLLLDEFEKTDYRVLDLFLQIFDEGMFSDSLGRKVNARNFIFVATSNAGSQYIFDAVKAGQNLQNKQKEIVDKVIHDGIFKPELVNRFDGVILFYPLSDAQLKEVSKMMLMKLAWRLKERGMTLVVNDALLDFLVSHGHNPEFGARPLNRVIQDSVEKVIADKIISGEYKVGSNIVFTPEDLK